MLEKIKIWVENNHHILKIIRPLYKHTLQKYFIYKQTKLFNTYNTELLANINLAFNDLNIEYWLDFGTLLGALREGKFIEHDRDIDLGILGIPSSSQRDKILETLSKYGFERKYYFMYDNIIREETYIYKGVSVDLFYYTHDNNNITGYYFLSKETNYNNITTSERTFIPIKVTFPFNGIKNYKFLGIDTKIPINATEYIITRYGNNYLTPIKSWDNLHSPGNISVLTDEVGHYYKSK